MDKDKSRSEIPILRFFGKHKWRIILPVLGFGAYFILPFYFPSYPSNAKFIQSRLLVTAGQNKSLEQLNKEVAEISDQIQSDKSLLRLMDKYDLFANERKDGVPDDQLLEKMRIAVVVGPEKTSPVGSVIVYVLTGLRNEDPRKALAISEEIASRFASTPGLSVTRSDLIPRGPSFFLAIFLTLPGVLCSLVLIFIWEIPFLFYSRKTQEMVFDPIRADWQDELRDAKMNGDILEAVRVDIRYSFAFVGAALAASPIGNLLEFAGKVVR